MLLAWITFTILAAVTVWIAVWVLTSILVGKSGKQKQFVANSAPATGPQGFYKGAAYLLGDRPVPWLGKSLESHESIGFNIFTPTGAWMLRVLTPLYKLFRINSDGNTDAYYFKTSIGRGLKDAGTRVFKLDYNSPENPFLIRIILDEMVEIGPNEFLGKVHLKVSPGYYATIGFFGLRK